MQSVKAQATSRVHLKCQYCDRSFLYPSMLMRHMTKHVNERTGRCRICNKGYPDKTKLYAHVHTHRKEQTPLSETESNELADNLHMQNPLQWVPPLEDIDLQEGAQAADLVLLSAQRKKRPINQTSGAKTSAEMWSSGDQPVIDLTTGAGDVSPESVEDIHKDRRSRMSQQAEGSTKNLERREIICIKKKTSSQLQSPSVSCANSESSQKLPSTFESPENSGSSGQGGNSPPKGHFMLCPNGRALKCNYCSFMCRRTCGRMIKHLQVHGIRSRNQCKSCGLGFLKKSELHDHENTCSQASLAPQCIECGKTFSFRSLLRLHMNTHFNQKPYKCQQCHMTFDTAALCLLHVEKQHGGNSKSVVGSVHKCEWCPRQFRNIIELQKHAKSHLIHKPFKCSLCGIGFATSSARHSHIQNVHKDNQNPTNFMKSTLKASKVTSVYPPVSSLSMTMPIVVSVSSQSEGDSSTMVPVRSSIPLPKSVEGPSELTAGSPETMDGLDSSGGLVYMRKELNPDAENEEREIRGPSVLRSWSVSESSSFFTTAEPAGAPVEESSSQVSGSQIMFFKKEVEDNVTSEEDKLSNTMSRGESSESTFASGQLLEPSSTDNEILIPPEAYRIHIQQYPPQNLPSRSENKSRLLEVGRVVGSPSPDGSYGHQSSDNITNPESPCLATSTRRSLDTSEAFTGSHRCNYCDISFGDPIMHYLHMGWHVTGDPWKCNGCGQECLGKMDFFLHLYKAGHN